MNFSSEKRKAQTIDRSHFQRGAKQSSSSRFQSPGKSAASQFSQTKIFEISVQSLLPLINTLKQQNTFMSSQREQIQNQLQKLSSLSQLLVQQNQALRKHYYQRNVDLQQLIQSIKVNTKENISDMNHQIHLCREHNMILAKNIENLNNQKQLIQQNLSKLQQQLLYMTQQNLTKEMNLTNYQVKSQQMLKTLKFPSSAPSLVDLQNLQKQVCDLHLDLSKIKKNNLKILQYLKEKRITIQTQRPTLKYQTVETIKNGKQLRNQLQSIKVDTIREQNKSKDLINLNQNLIGRLNQLQRENEKKRLKLGRIVEKIKTTQANLYKSQQQHKKLIPDRESKLYKKNQAQKQIESYNLNIQKLIQAHESKKSILAQQAAHKISEIKEEIEKYGQDSRVQISRNYPQRTEYQKKISNLKYQLSLLDQRTVELQTVIENLKNPQMDRNAMRMQYQMKTTR